jgi:hypothetical protein
MLEVFPRAGVKGAVWAYPAAPLIVARLTLPSALPALYGTPDADTYAYLTEVLAELFVGPTSLEPDEANTASYRAFAAATEQHRDPHRRIRCVK